MWGSASMHQHNMHQTMPKSCDVMCPMTGVCKSDQLVHPVSFDGQLHSEAARRASCGKDYAASKVRTTAPAVSVARERPLTQSFTELPAEMRRLLFGLCRGLGVAVHKIWSDIFGNAKYR